MNLVRLIIAFAISINLTLPILGQSLEPGTQYFDDVRGDEIVVTNAWDNVSNRVHQLIQVVSPKTDISGKQDLLPYPTNAIPFSVLTNVPTHDYSYITDGTNVINSNLEYVRGGENKWVVKFTKDEYADADFLPHEYSFELLLNQYGQWQNWDLGSEHTLWYQDNNWFFRVYFDGHNLLLENKPGNENADYVDFTNSYGHWECSRILYKRDKIALVSESITNNTLRLPMTDSTTSERVYLKVENGEVNIYKVQ